VTSRAGRRGVPAALALAGALAVPGCTSAVTGQASPAPVTLEGTRVATYPPGQAHSRAAVDYPETPPVGGQHDPVWADCTGTVYDVPIRPENAVHSLEHGAVWVTYDPAVATADDVRTLTELVSGRPGLMLSPYPDQQVAVSLQAWDHQLRVRSAADPQVAEFADLLVFNPDATPEPGATCENPAFVIDPRRPA
jgi:hypothetical protein